MDDREAAQHDIAELVMALLPHGVHDPSQADRCADFRGLPRTAGSGADHFLQGDDIRIEVTYHLGDPRRNDAAVHPPAAVDVVSGNPDVDMTPCPGVAHCWRSRIQTNGPAI